MDRNNGCPNSEDKDSPGRSLLETLGFFVGFLESQGPLPHGAETPACRYERSFVFYETRRGERVPSHVCMYVCGELTIRLLINLSPEAFLSSIAGFRSDRGKAVVEKKKPPPPPQPIQPQMDPVGREDVTRHTSP